ncbi:aldo/keto reductase [Sutterella sp.]|uniref:aldo/keto reductase n=1 Tax=Sutterella sp. TaxID=1981025 RepID=UPI0026E0BC44|nr:aldo/keto reductase [Sutterella sp.]MDO5531661.1 aldo/keto reductase [Sutterella sp.]
MSEFITTANTSRRTFLRSTLLATGGLLSGQAFAASAAAGAANTGAAAGSMEFVRLNNGVEMPILGYGTLRIPREKCADCVAQAIRTGWRLIDTAKNYSNEVQVGEGIRRSGIDRKELFVTTKLWIKDYGYEQAKAGFEASCRRLGLDYIDLYLLHQPFGDVHGAWRALEELHAEGRIRAIGVSNFFPDRLTDLILTSKVVPAVNQIEFSPHFQRWSDKRENEEAGTLVESWGPLLSGMYPEVFDEPVLKEIAAAHGKTVAQVILRWLTQNGVITVVKTERPERMVENLGSMSFRLTAEEIQRIASLDRRHTMYKDHRSAKDVRWFHNEATRPE